jgi:mono/diheme cytochrome c family protein
MIQIRAFVIVLLLLLVSNGSMALLASNGALAADVDFTKQIQPIFAEHCYSCHGEKKKLGKLRLHTVAAIQEKASADEEWLVAGKPDESELFERLVLPADHKKRMPKKADPLPKEKIDLIRQWIEQGAVLAATAAVVDRAKPEPPAELPLPEVAAADPAAIERVVAAGGKVMQLYAGSPLLQITYAMNDKQAGDANLAPLADVAEQVYSLDLSGSNVSEGGMAILGTLKNLSSLHLENSQATDAGLAHVTSLERLQYLNVYGTAVTDAGMASLEGLKHLRKLYLWKTTVSYDVAMALEKKIPGLQVNLGFDHPVIARQRLTKEVEQAKKHTEEANADEAKLKGELEAATKAKQAAQERLDEVQKELKSLEGGKKEKPAAPDEEAKQQGDQQAAAK